MTTPRLTSTSIELPGALEAIETFFDNGWSDGLPVVPPTPGAVGAMLDGASLAPEAILGVEPVKGAIITAEKAAINAVMAGCKPEYMPVVVAATEAITQPEFNLHGITVSTMGAAILLVVNGPITKQLEINSGVSVFGPGHRANATVGRAIRLIVQNVLGTRSNDGLDKGTLGHPGKYTWCIAENEDRLPWEPLHVTRGLNENDSAVTVFSGLSGTPFGEHETNDPEQILDAYAQRMYPLGPGVGETVIVIAPEHGAHFEREDWDKRRVEQYLFESARKTVTQWAEMGLPSGTRTGQAETPANSDDVRNLLASPESVIPIVAGGDGGAWSMVIPTWGRGLGSKAVTRQIVTNG
jgi:hypothetical protein